LRPHNEHATQLPGLLVVAFIDVQLQTYTFMKPLFSRKTYFALAIVIAVTVAGNVGHAQDQSVPSAAGDSALPANIPPGSPLADVVKLVQAGVDVDTIRTYVANATGPFNLDADDIIFLKDEGLPSDVINAMMAHDKNLSTANQPSTTAQAATTTTEEDTTPPSAPVTVEYFNETLSPYGSWVNVDGYGRCWRPTTVIYDSSWRPYCDRGHWVYTDCGWYWDSDYSWGVTFHYGRWFRDARFGWCWWPDTVWSSSWVTWRSSDDYCGWAPLPPFTAYQPGAGFYYRGASVAVGFDFGLDADFFMFVPVGHFCDRRPRSYCVAQQQAVQIYRRTTIINNFSVNNRFVANGGIPVQRLNTLAHLDIRPVNVGDVHNAQRQGWRGSVSNSEIRNANGNHQPGFNQSLPMRNQNRNDSTPVHPQSFVTPENHSGNRDSSIPANTHQNLNPSANNNPVPGTPFNRDQQKSQPADNAVHNQSQPAFNETPRQAGSPFTTAPAEQQHQMPQVTIPARSEELPPRVESRQDNIEVVPRNSAPPSPPPAPEPAPSQSHNAETPDHSQDKDRQNH
jgi:hypothetical protein